MVPLKFINFCNRSERHEALAARKSDIPKAKQQWYNDDVTINWRGVVYLWNGHSSLATEGKIIAICGANSRCLFL
ncbi:conserved hypothetical protein [Ricinus communis]|uniref:Uncharacterized protein n=1 Tax=Ricinus communis TaxID=3988 RepID=B9SIT2_RICCO|nr:conserved hypothetical protein [Ricinus communis]